MPYPITSPAAWPALDWDQWEETAKTLHMFMQIVGKTRIALTSTQNHWWNVPFYVTARGLSTSAMPISNGGLLDIEFDFVSHDLIFRLSTGQTEVIRLAPQSVAVFFDKYKKTLEALDVELHIDPRPVELSQPIRFQEDTVHESYDPDAAWRFWQVLSQTSVLLEQFSTNFYGKISPVHFFWGSLDLAVTRFNGRRVPDPRRPDAIQAEAYSHECISAGFWPGNEAYSQAAFYAYVVPVPLGLDKVTLTSKGSFNKQLAEFILNYAEVRQSSNPAATILDFLNATYSAAADAADWDRQALDRNDKFGDAGRHL